MQDLVARKGLRSFESFVAFQPADCERSIVDRFEKQAAQHCNRPAVRLQNGDVTYGQLNADANRAARLLLENLSVKDDSGTRKTVPIALLLNQGYESIVWTLAILKAGLCYAPLDQRLPQNTLRAILDQLGPGAVIASPNYLEVARALGIDQYPLIDAGADREQYLDEDFDVPLTPDSPAYVFFTSGSTGTPKGVVDCHRNVLHNILRYTNTLKFAPGDVLSLVQNPSFSGTVSTLFGALLNGAAVAPFDLQTEGLAALSSWLRRARVTVFHGVPSIFRQLSDPAGQFSDIRLVRLEGDSAATRDLEHFRDNFSDDCTLVNGLGATECGLVRQFFFDKQTRFDGDQPLPIGYPVPDMIVRIVDGRGGPVPYGSSGEVVVESAFLSRGYWRDVELTAEKFVNLEKDQRRYRTGDLGRMSEDGCLVHLGRVDHRARIAGEFTDAAIIEAQLLAIPGVEQAAVRDFEDRTGERRLYAYLAADAEVNVTQLRRALSVRLASSLVPSAFVFLDALPLTEDFKVDYQRLLPPGSQRPRLANDYVAPQTAGEKQIARLCCEILEVQDIGVNDSFFDLGGDSLRAARLISRLKQEAGLELSIVELFERRTVRALAQALNDPSHGAAIETRRRSDERHDVAADHRVAIIGMAGRFPGADSLEQFWENLRVGRESITVFSNNTARGLLSDVDLFDAALFRLTPRQAQMLDPQQRIWLECVHRALEDAGLPLDEFGFAGANRNIGVFAGGRESTYLWHLVGGDGKAVQSLLQRSNDEAHQLMMSNDNDSIATRTSFVMGFHGPSINVQTACSTSLVAVAQACAALASGQCDMAIAGGVALTFPQQPSDGGEKATIQSRDGHCCAFDAGATGTVFGDGVGAVVLKRFADAMADGDRIDAVIRGWAVNNDGANKASFAAPSVQGQTEVVARAQEHAGVQAGEIGYIEAHGTGTPVGDPIEFAALERAFRRGTDARGFCGLGSVKSNIGHLDTAAGIAGLIKTVLVLQRGEIPATLHFHTANPEIDLDASPFFITNRLHSWTGDAPRIAGVSSFGVGGTNCHVVVQQPEPYLEEAPASALPAYLVTLSAVTAPALDALESDYTNFFRQHGQADLAAIAATAQQSRSRYAHKSAIVAGSAAQMSERLGRRENIGRWSGKTAQGGDPAIGFLFAGQGAQYAGMGRALYNANSEFRRLLELCDHCVRAELERPLLEAMFTAPDELLKRTEYAQPALFALEYSLAELLRACGITPQFVLGHSIGEYVAACIAGVFSVQEGMVLAAKRGRLMQQLAGTGKMLAIVCEQPAPSELLDPYAGRVSIAAYNSPTQTVVAGAATTIDQLSAQLRAQGIYHRELAVSHAFHSPQITPALAPLLELVARIDLRQPTLQLFSNLYGRRVTREVTRPDYWRDHASRPVQFAAGIGAMMEAGCDLAVEIGPDSVLAEMVRGNAGERVLETIATLRRGENDWTALLETIAHLYVRGAPLNWRALENGRKARPVRLPAYPFQRARYWYDGPLVRAAENPADHPLLGRQLRLPGSDEIRFEARFSQTAPHFLADHRLFGISLPPAASHLAMLAQAASYLGGSNGYFRFENLHMLRPLLLPDGCVRDVQLIFRPERQNWNVELASVASDEAADAPWTVHMIGVGSAHSAASRSAAQQGLDLNEIRARCRGELSGREFYSRIWANQGGTGSAFRWIDSISRQRGEALGRAACPHSVSDIDRYRLHPGLIEAACQVLHSCETIETAPAMEANGRTFVPFSIDAFELFGEKATHAFSWCHARLRELGESDVIADLAIFTDAGKLVAKLTGFHLRPITRDAVKATPAQSGFKSIPIVHGAPDANRKKPTAAEMAKYLQVKCAEISGYPETTMSVDNGFLSLGLDSLVAMTLANHLRRDFGCTVPLTQILMSQSLNSLADAICRSIPA